MLRSLSPLLHTLRGSQQEVTLAAEPRELPSDVVDIAQDIAGEMGVSPLIHPADFLFWADYDRLSGNAFESVSNYFKGGRQNAISIQAILSEHQQQKSCRLLDFAAGYSRIARHFARRGTGLRVTVADIHPEAVQFARSLGMKARRSTWDPAQFRPGLFHATAAISFFTHMPREDWRSWLSALARTLVPGGVLLFTTHGRPAMRPMGISEEPADGFGFYQQSEQKDLSMDRYATTLTLPDYVRAAAAASTLEVLEFRESGFGYQDLWVMKRMRP